MKITKYILILLLIIGVSLSVFIAAYFYIPYSLLQKFDFKGKKLGSLSVTTISTDTVISGFPDIYNANLSVINNGKVDVASTTWIQVQTLGGLTTAGNLVTVGALSSGSLASGFTTITVPLGGTGAASLTQYAVLLGNGTGALTTVSGFGLSGQSLVSNGAGMAPTWQSISFNTTDDYALSGDWNYTSASTVRIVNFHASATPANPFYLNNTATNWGGFGAAASGSVPMWDGSGRFSIADPDPTVTTIFPEFAGYATSTMPQGYNSNTEAGISLIHVPKQIRLNKITFKVTIVTSAGTIKYAFYSEDGQTKIQEETTGTISSVGLHSDTLSSELILNPGNYYFAIMTQSTANIGFSSWRPADQPFSYSVASEPKLNVIVTGLTANTLPSSFTPSTFGTGVDYAAPLMRFDN